MNLVLYLITVLIWGTTWIAIKFQLGTVAPELSLVYRFGLASGLLIIYCTLRKYKLKYTPKQHLLMALQGLLLFSANYYLVYLATQYLTSGLIAVVFSSIVLTNIAFNALLFKKPVNQKVLLGALVGLIGITLVFLPEILAFDLTRAGSRGLVLAIFSTLISSLGNMASAWNQSKGLPVVQTNAISMTYGTLFLAAFALLHGVPIHFEASASYLISLLYLALFGSVIAFGTYLTLLGRIGADRAAYVTILFPIIALAISTLFEGYHWQPNAIIGIVLVLVGNLIVLEYKKQAKTEHAQAHVPVNKTLTDQVLGTTPGDSETSGG